MKQIVILSGKGGTGKTSLVAALAHLASRQSRLVLADADVDAANLELVLDPRPLERHEFTGGSLASIDVDLCSGCGRCLEVCRFEAIIAPAAAHADGSVPSGSYAVDPLSCEGCGVCRHQCPSQAVRLDEVVSGQWSISETRFGPLVHAALLAGHENSGKLVSEVRQQARTLAHNRGADYVIVDGPPGIGCPVIASLAGADLALMVTEPTVTGAHDLQRVLELARHFRVPAAVCINKYDVSTVKTVEIVAHAGARGVPVIGMLPFDEAFPRAIVQGRPVTECTDGYLTAIVQQVWDRVQAMAGSQGELKDAQ